MGLSFHGEGVTCHKCGRCISGVLEDEWELTKQFGCEHCDKRNYPKYRLDYNSGSNVWVIFKEYWVTKNSFFGFGPPREYLVEEVLRNGAISNYPEYPELEFETLKEAQEYIRILKKQDEIA